MAFENLTLQARVWCPLGLQYLFKPQGLITQKNLHQDGALEFKPDPPHKNSTPIKKSEVSSCERAPEKLQEQAWNPIPKELWPPIWQEQALKTRKANLAWTYWNLGPDLLAIAGKLQENESEREQRMSRFAFLKTLYKDLGFPPATHTFWPVHFDKGNNISINSDLYWSGLKFLGCRGAIIMGSPAAKALIPDKQLKPLSQLRIKGILTWILWDIDSFARKSENYERMLFYLEKVLSPFSPCPEAF